MVKIIKPLQKNKVGFCSISITRKDLRKLEVEENKEEDTYMEIKKLEIEDEE